MGTSFYEFQDGFAACIPREMSGWIREYSSKKILMCSHWNGGSHFQYDLLKAATAYTVEKNTEDRQLTCPTLY